MKILVVNKFFWNKGGSERVMFDLIRGYETAGHEVSHFAMRSPRDEPSPFSGHFMPEVSYHDGGGGLRAAMRAIYSRDAKRRIRAVIRESRPDVAHLHNFHHQLSPSIVDALREEGVPCVHTLHDYKVICPNYLLYTEGRPCERCRGGRFHQAVLHRCLHGRLGPSVVAFLEMTWHRHARTLERGIRCFVAPSRFLTDKLVEFGVPAERIRHVPNGLDPAPYREATGGDEFLYAGRLSAEKGVKGLVEAVVATPGVRLAIAGTGPQEEELRAAVAERCPDRVRLLGFLDREELLERIAGARAVVLPSEWYENAPIAVLEALASGVPVIGAAIGGIPEVVRHGETGLLFSPGDRAALGARLAELHADADRARELGRRGRELVHAEYGLERQLERMLALLGEVATSASR